MGGDSEVESEDEDDMDDDEEGEDSADESPFKRARVRLREEINLIKPFENEEGASKSLKNFTRTSSISVN